MYFIEMPGARDFTRTNKTDYLAIDERALGKKRPFVCFCALCSEIFYNELWTTYVSFYQQ